MRAARLSAHSAGWRHGKPAIDRCQNPNAGQSGEYRQPARGLHPPNLSFYFVAVPRAQAALPMPFAALGLSPALAHAAQAVGFTVPTPIQTEAIPAILNGQDLLGIAQTGSGKTAAFGLPLLQAVQLGATGQASRHATALVLVPTRELAAQVGEVLRDLAGHLQQPPKVAVVFGGVSINPQMMGLRGGADIVVATPGRLLDLVEHNAIQLGKVAHLVLDEADRLLDLGFAEELQRVLALLPAKRQNLFFSATFAAPVQALADGLLHQPLRVEIAPTPDHTPDIAQRAIAVDDKRRTQDAGFDAHLIKPVELDAPIRLLNDARVRDAQARARAR